MHRAFAHLADDLGNVVDAKPALIEASGAVDIRLDHGATGVWLEGQVGRVPAPAKTIEQRTPIAVSRASKAVEEAVHALKHGARTQERGAGQVSGAQTRLRRPARMHAFGPAAVRQILDDAARH